MLEILNRLDTLYQVRSNISYLDVKMAVLISDDVTVFSVPEEVT